MSVIIRLQNLSWAASSLDIRQFFHGMSIPDGGVHIIGGEMGDAFIAFSTDEDARQAMMLNGRLLNECAVRLLLSSKTEMQNVIAAARAKKTTPEVNPSLAVPVSYEYDQFQSYTPASSGQDNDYPNYYQQQQQREVSADVTYKEQFAPSDVRMDSGLGYQQDRPRVDRFPDESHVPIYQSNDQTVGSLETSTDSVVQDEGQSAANYKQRQTMYGMQYTRESDSQKGRGDAGQFGKQSSYSDERGATPLYNRQSVNKLDDRQEHQFPRQQAGPLTSHFPRERSSEPDARDSQRVWHGWSEEDHSTRALSSQQQHGLPRDTRLSDGGEFLGGGEENRHVSGDIRMRNDPRGLQHPQHTPGLINTPSDRSTGMRDPRLGPHQMAQAGRNRGDQRRLSDDYNRPPHLPDPRSRGPDQGNEDIGTLMKKLPSLLGEPGGVQNRPLLDNQPSTDDRRREMSRHEELNKGFSMVGTPNRNDGGLWNRQGGPPMMRDGPSNSRNPPFVGGGPRDGPPFDGTGRGPLLGREISPGGNQPRIPPNKNGEEQEDFDWEQVRMRREGPRGRDVSSSGDIASIGRGGPLIRDEPQLGRIVPMTIRGGPLLGQDGRPVSMDGRESNSPMDRDGLPMRGNELHVSRDGPPMTRDGQAPMRGVGPPVGRDRLSAGRDGSPMTRDGPPGRRDVPLIGRDGMPMGRDGPPVRRDGPPVGRDGPSLGRGGQPVGRNGSPMGRDVPPMRRDGQPMVRDGPPERRDGPLTGRDGPLMRRDGPPIGRGGLPMGRDGRPVGRDGPPMGRDGLPMGRDGLPMGRDGPPVGRDGPPLGRDGPPIVRGGLPLGRDGPPVGRDGPPMGRDGLPMGRDGLPMRRDGPPVGRDGPPIGRGGLPMGRDGPPVGRDGLPMGRDGLPMRRDGPPVGRDGPPVGRDEPPMGRDGPPVGRDGLPMGRDGLPIGRDGLPMRRDALPLGRDEPPVQRDGPLMDRDGRLVGRDVLANRRDGSLLNEPLANRGREPTDRDWNGPLMRRDRSPTSRDAPPRGKDDLPMGRDLLPLGRGGPLMGRDGPPMGRNDPPIDRDGPPMRRDGPPGRREGLPMGRVDSPMGRDEPSMRREGMPMGRVDSPMGRVESSMRRDGPPMGRAVPLLDTDKRTMGRDGLPWRPINVEDRNGPPIDRFGHTDKDIRNDPPEMGIGGSQRKAPRPLLDRGDLRSVQRDESKGGLEPLLPTPDRNSSDRRNQQGSRTLSPGRKLQEERSDHVGLLPVPNQDRSRRTSSDPDRRSSDRDRRSSDRGRRSSERDKRRDRSPRRRSRSRDRSDSDKNERSHRRRARSPSAYALITGVHSKVNYREIRKFFGGIVITNIKMYNLDTQKYPDGFALLKFPFERDLERAIGISGERLYDRTVRVQRCSAEDYENGESALKNEGPSPAKKPKESSSSRTSDSKTNSSSSSRPSDSKTSNSSSSRPSDSKTSHSSSSRPSDSKPSHSSSSRPSEPKTNSSSSRPSDSKTNGSSSRTPDSNTNTSSSRTSDSKSSSSSEDGTWVVLDNLPSRVNKSDVFTFFKGFELIPTSLYIQYVGNSRENGSTGKAYMEFRTPASRKRSLGLHQKNKIGGNVIGVRGIEKEEAKKCIESGSNSRPEKTGSNPAEGTKVTQGEKSEKAVGVNPASAPPAKLNTNPVLAAPAKSSEPLLETPQTIKPLPKLKPLVRVANNQPPQPKPGVLPTPSRTEVNLDKLVASRCMVGMKNLPPPVTVVNVMGFLREFQPIADTVRLNFSNNGLPTGEAMVAFATPAVASNVIRQKNNSVINGHVIMVFLVT